MRGFLFGLLIGILVTVGGGIYYGHIEIDGLGISTNGERVLTTLENEEAPASENTVYADLPYADLLPTNVTLATFNAGGGSNEHCPLLREITSNDELVGWEHVPTNSGQSVSRSDAFAFGFASITAFKGAGSSNGYSARVTCAYMASGSDYYIVTKRIKIANTFIDPWTKDHHGRSGNAFTAICWQLVTRASQCPWKNHGNAAAASANVSGSNTFDVYCPSIERVKANTEINEWEAHGPTAGQAAIRAAIHTLEGVRIIAIKDNVSQSGFTARIYCRYQTPQWNEFTLTKVVKMPVELRTLSRNWYTEDKTGGDGLAYYLFCALHNTNTTLCAWKEYY